MKLKYILPVATIASVATVITPLVTSCGIKWQHSHNFMNGGYESIVDPLPSTDGPLSTTEATKKYFDDVAANHNILANDKFLGLQQQYDDMKDVITKDEAMLNVNNVDADNHLLSFRFCWNFAYTQIDSEQGEIKVTYDLDIECKDIQYALIAYPIAQYADPIDVTWNVTPTAINEDDPLTELDKHDNWQIKGTVPNVEDSEGGNVFHVDFNKDKKPTEDEMGAFWNALYFLEIGESYYLSNIKQKQIY